MSVRRLAREERSDLAAFLATLTPEEWDAPSLCAGWRVRDVIAHVITGDELGRRRFYGNVAKAGFSVNRMTKAAVARSATRTPAELLEALERHLDPRGPLTVLGCVPALFDAVVHHQDIRRPLGKPREIPRERLVTALRAACLSPFVSGPSRVRGLRLVAIDVGWSRGRGPEVSGPGESLLMAITGRRDAVDELSGPGREILAARIGEPAAEPA